MSALGRKRTLALALAPAIDHYAAMHKTHLTQQTVERTFIEAIALKRLVTSVYNGSQLLLAPHQLFARHGALFISAFNTGRNWRRDDERRLGLFKLEGLSNVVLAPGSFEPLPNFKRSPLRQGDEYLFSI